MALCIARDSLPRMGISFALEWTNDERMSVVRATFPKRPKPPLPTVFETYREACIAFLHACLNQLGEDEIKRCHHAMTQARVALPPGGWRSP